MSRHLVTFLFLLQLLCSQPVTTTKTKAKVSSGSWGVQYWGGGSECRVGMIQCLEGKFACGRPFPKGFLEQEMMFMNYWQHPGCRTCEAALSTWTKFSEKCEELKIRIGLMNSTTRRWKNQETNYDSTNVNILKEAVGGKYLFTRTLYLNSEIIPSVYHVKDFEFREYEYKGPLTVSDLVDFVKEQKWKSIEFFKLNVSETPEFALALTPVAQREAMQWWHFCLVGVSFFCLMFAAYQCICCCRWRRSGSESVSTSTEGSEPAYWKRKKKGCSNTIEL